MVKAVQLPMFPELDSPLPPGKKEGSKGIDQSGQPVEFLLNNCPLELREGRVTVTWTLERVEEPTGTPTRTYTPASPTATATPSVTPTPQPTPTLGANGLLVAVAEGPRGIAGVKVTLSDAMHSMTATTGDDGIAEFYNAALQWPVQVWVHELPGWTHVGWDADDVTITPLDPSGDPYRVEVAWYGAASQLGIVTCLVKQATPTPTAPPPPEPVAVWDVRYQVIVWSDGRIEVLPPTVTAGMMEGR